MNTLFLLLLIPCVDLSTTDEFQERLDRSITRLTSLRRECVTLTLAPYGPDYAGRWVDVMCQLQRRVDLSSTDEFQERFDRSITRVIGLRHECVTLTLSPYGPSYSGRWVDLMCQRQRHTGKGYGIAGVVKEMLTYQQPDGRIESPRRPFMFGQRTLAIRDYQPWKCRDILPTSIKAGRSPFDVGRWWGQGRGLVGLTEYYRLTKDKETLEAAKQLGDFCVNHFPLGQTYMIDSFEDYMLGILEGVVMLWEVTKDKRYLTLAKAIGDRVASNSLFDDKLTHGVQTHSFLTARRGLLRLYLATKEKRYLDGLLRAHKEVEKIAWPTGGIVEVYGINNHTEACSTADWLRLNLQLWKVTGEAKYLEIARTTLKQLYREQLPNGGFANGSKRDGTIGKEMRYCCSMSGPRAFCDVLGTLGFFTKGAKR